MFTTLFLNIFLLLFSYFLIYHILLYDVRINKCFDPYNVRIAPYFMLPNHYIFLLFALIISIFLNISPFISTLYLLSNHSFLINDLCVIYCTEKNIINTYSSQTISILYYITYFLNAYF